MAELPERLREAADAHRPDRARMLARVERAMAASRPGTADRNTAPDRNPAADRGAAADRAAPEPEHRPGTAPSHCASCAARESAPPAAAQEPPVHRIGPASGPGDGEPHGPIRKAGTWEGPPAPWVRVAAVAAAVAGAVGLGGLAVGAASHDRDPKPPAVSPAHSVPATTPPPEGAGTADLSAGRSRPPGSPHPGTSGAARPGGHDAGGPTAHTPTTPSTTGTTPAGTAGSGSAGGGTGGTGTPPTPGSDRVSGTSARAGVSSGSNASWMEEDITLTCDQPLTSLTVELRVAMTPGVSSTGQYSSAPGSTAVTTTVEGDELVYRWTLDQGQTLDPGTYTFAGQFGHDDGDRDTGGDRFTVSASGPEGSVSAGGGY